MDLRISGGVLADQEKARVGWFKERQVGDEGMAQAFLQERNP